MKLQSITEKQIQKFRKYLVNEEKSDATIEKYIRDVTAFVKWLGGEIPRKERVIQYKERLIAQYKTASVNSILSSLNMFFEYADWHKMKVKTLKTQRKIFADKSKELTKTEYERLLTAAKDRKNEKLYYLIQTIASTGLRVSEIKFITFEAIKRRQAIINCKGKINNGIALSFEGDEILQAFSVKDAESKLTDETELIILDVNLPDGNGIDLCKKIRETSNVPIIMLTANDMEIDIVTGLESGADDYITKPFSLAVLRVRVNAVARRKKDGNKKVIYKNFTFDFENMKFSYDGKSVELSKTEQKLLKMLMQNIGKTMSRDILIDRVWSDGAEFVEENALSVCIKRLRQKLPSIPIKTVYGIGYVLEK